MYTRRTMVRAHLPLPRHALQPAIFDSLSLILVSMAMVLLVSMLTPVIISVSPPP